MNNKIKNCINNLLKLVVNEYTIFILLAVLALVAINVITSAVIIFIALAFFGAIFYTIKTTNKKKNYFICLLISCVVLVAMAGSFIGKIPALSYNFGAPKFISTSNEINFCLDKGIKVVSFVPKNAKLTQYVIKEDVSVTGNRNIGQNDGHIEFYYSIVKFENMDILMKHSEKSIPHNKVVTGYLSKFDSRDKQVYDEFAQEKLLKAIIVVDSNILDSDMLSWKIWTILQLVISLMSVALCIYIVCNYYRKREHLI